MSVVIIFFLFYETDAQHRDVVSPDSAGEQHRHIRGYIYMSAAATNAAISTAGRYFVSTGSAACNKDKYNQLFLKAQNARPCRQTVRNVAMLP